LANSPSVCPPIPSATAQRPAVAWSRHASSFTSRTWPRWERDADVHRYEGVPMLTRAALEVLRRGLVVQRSQQHRVVGGIGTCIGNIHVGGLIDHLADIRVVVRNLLHVVEH